MFKYLFCIIIFMPTLYACALCGNSKVSWVDSYMNIYTDASMMLKIHTEWKFDSGTSKDIKKTYSVPLNETDKETMYNAIATLQKPYFMTTLLINSKDVPFKAENFELFFEKETAVIAFDIPINQSLADIKTIEIMFLDSTRAMAFLANLDHTTLHNNSTFSIQKSNGFKVIKEMMTTINYVKLSVAP